MSEPGKREKDFESTQTVEFDLDESWKAAVLPRGGPRLRLLYHVDLSRIGAYSVVDLRQGEWLTVGRRDPQFISPSADATWSSIDDPFVSRRQIRLRWLPDDEQFEVEPISGAKLGLRALRATGDERVLASEVIDGPTRLPVGSAVEVESRVLIGLEGNQPFRDPGQARLGLVGESGAMWQLRNQITTLRQFRKTALILGATGVGKELVARALHGDGRAPFKVVNCAALPSQLVESVLFGHRKGAFTGADADAAGLFRAADGGTLFLDELGEMPIEIQPKLLRVLQEGRVTAVGATSSDPVDVRLLSATNRDPHHHVETGRLRLDLYHRVAVHTVRVPSLHERRFDIPELFVHFLEHHRDDHPSIDWLWSRSRKPGLPLATVVSLLRRTWPGNVRELQNLAERTVLENLGGRPFKAPDLNEEAAQNDARPLSTAPRETRDESSAQASVDAARHTARVLGVSSKTFGKLIEGVDVPLLHDAEEPEPEVLARLHSTMAELLYERLVRHDFKQSRVAASLGLSGWTLIRLMQRCGIPRPTDLSRADIDAALEDCEGDLEAAAVKLRVSHHGLKLRWTALTDATET